MPRKPGEPHWFEFLQFNREAFRRYLRHYIAEVKKTNPDFQYCSNWAFTDHMPEPVSAPVDFLSGDYAPEDSVNSARLSGRYLARQGKPWDLMAWSFSRGKTKDGRNQKTAVQLQREAAVVLALGGGFQAYFTQKRDGSIREERVPVMAEVAKFCRARQALCHHATQVPQVALLFSTAAHYRKSNGLFARDLARMSGTLQALLESQQSVELLGRAPPHRPHGGIPADRRARVGIPGARASKTNWSPTSKAAAICCSSDPRRWPCSRPSSMRFVVTPRGVLFQLLTASPRPP